MAHVEIYSTMSCASCIRAKRLFASKGIEVLETDVSANREPMIERSGRMTVPQIFVNGRHVGGYDDLVALERRGALDEWLAMPISAD